MNQKTRKTVIIVDYRCNNNCQFCNEAERRQTVSPRSTLEVKQAMLEAKQRGATYLELIGGELSLRSDLEELIKFASHLNFTTILMATNGRRYAYLDFARRVIDAGLTDIIFSIHGSDAKTHDALTKSPGSFDQLMAGLQNFKKLGFQRIGSNTTIVKQNYRHLPRLGQFIYDQGIRNSEFIFVDPSEGGACRNFAKLVPRISQAAPYMRECLGIGREHQVVHWAVRYVPLCYFSDYLDQISELKEAESVRTEHIAPDFKNYDVTASRQKLTRRKTAKCRGCKLFNVCEGLWMEYLKRLGDDELKPML